MFSNQSLALSVECLYFLCNTVLESREEITQNVTAHKQPVVYWNVWLISISLNPRTTILCDDLWGLLETHPSNLIHTEQSHNYHHNCISPPRGHQPSTYFCEKALMKKKAFIRRLPHYHAENTRLYYREGALCHPFSTASPSTAEALRFNPSVRWHTVSFLAQWQPFVHT